MSASYRLTEPHPSVPTSHYLHAGRGGAGNAFLVNPKNITSGPTAAGPASVTALRSRSPNAYFAAGRGGAGNMRHEKERAKFTFEEEVAQDQRLAEHDTHVYHIGRGGAGNLVDEMKPRRKNSASSNLSTESSGSQGRARRSFDAAWSRLSRSLSRH